MKNQNIPSLFLQFRFFMAKLDNKLEKSYYLGSQNLLMKIILNVIERCDYYLIKYNYDIEIVREKELWFNVAEDLCGFNPVGNNRYSSSKREAFYRTLMLTTNCFETMYNLTNGNSFDIKNDMELYLTACKEYEDIELAVQLQEWSQ